jgi:hypothetical protein
VRRCCACIAQPLADLAYFVQEHLLGSFQPAIAVVEASRDWRQNIDVISQYRDFTQQIPSWEAMNSVVMEQSSLMELKQGIEPQSRCHPSQIYLARSIGRPKPQEISTATPSRMPIR